MASSLSSSVCVAVPLVPTDIPVSDAVDNHDEVTLNKRFLRQHELHHRVRILLEHEITETIFAVLVS